MEIKNNGMNIKEMLTAGVDPNEMRREFNKQLVAAQKEIQEEKRNRDQRIREAQNNVVEAVLNYAIAVGVVEEGDPDAFRRLADKTFDGITNDLQKLKSSLDKVDNSKERKNEKLDADIDEILKGFLRMI